MKKIIELETKLKYSFSIPVEIGENVGDVDFPVSDLIKSGRNYMKLIADLKECLSKYKIKDMTDYEINDYISMILTRMIFTEDIKDDKVYSFVRSVSKLSDLTYENKGTKTGIYISSEEKMQRICMDNNWKILFDEGVCFEKLISENKPIRKIIDNMEYAYFFNENLTYKGLIVNCNENMSIASRWNELQEKKLKERVREQIDDICKFLNNNLENYFAKLQNQFPAKTLAEVKTKLQPFYEYEVKEYNEEDDIIFVDVSNGKVKYYLNPYSYVEECHGEWRLHEYISMVLPLFIKIAGITILATSIELREIFSDIVSKMILIIKELSIRNLGALIVLSDNDKEIREIMSERRNVNYAKLFDLNVENDFSTISKEKLISIMSIDGATIFNDNMKLIDFGNILKNSHLGDVEFGARTNAAKTASKYGMAIKVSEDGDVTLYRDGKIINAYDGF